MILPCSKKTEFLLQIVDYDVDDADDDENYDEDEVFLSPFWTIVGQEVL